MLARVKVKMWQERRCKGSWEGSCHGCSMLKQNSNKQNVTGEVDDLSIFWTLYRMVAIAPSHARLNIRVWTVACHHGWVFDYTSEL